MRTLVLALGLLASALARAEGPVLPSTSRLPALPQWTASVSTEGVLLTALQPFWGSATDGMAWEAQLAPRAGVLSLRATRLREVFQQGAWGFAVHLGGALHGVGRGPLDVGAGAYAGFLAGVGGPVLDVSLGAQLGAEAFARGPAVRVPARLLGGVRFGVGQIDLGLWGRMGVDVAPRLAPTARAEAGVLLAWAPGRAPIP